MSIEISPTKIKAERLQTRAVTDSAYVDELADRMRAGDVFPPIVLFSKGKESWLADGIHRLDAAIKAQKTIGVDERKGDWADAVEFACGANASHGLRRSNADKRRAVKLALSAFSNRSSRAIAELCGVGDDLVEEIRKASQVSENDTCKRVGRDGKVQSAIKAPRPRGLSTASADSPSVDFNPAELEAERGPAPAKDEWGAPIQLHAKKAFEAVPQFDEILTLLRSASRLFTQLAEHEGGRLLQRTNVSDSTRTGFRSVQITNAIRDLENCRPAHTICPHSVHEHHPHGEDCAVCHGLNWTPKLSKGRVSERLVSIAKERACSI
jgi:hypothetical protein